jgi:hypothetical protein
VDSFFTFITKGRLPNDAHTMLVHLADILGIHTILTTNFDDLDEQAFARLRMPLASFDVHQKASLPDAGLVLPQRSIVKLHGGRYGLRADFSLDELPSDPDMRNFADYLAGYCLGNAQSSHGRRHILAMGVSLSDARTATMIREAMHSIEDMHIYWVCYRDQDVGDVENELPMDDRLHTARCRLGELTILLSGVCHRIHTTSPRGRQRVAERRQMPPPLRHAHCGK